MKQGQLKREQIQHRQLRTVRFGGRDTYLRPGMSIQNPVGFPDQSRTDDITYRDNFCAEFVKEHCRIAARVAETLNDDGRTLQVDAERLARFTS